MNKSNVGRSVPPEDFMKSLLIILSFLFCLCYAGAWVANHSNGGGFNQPITVPIGF